MENIKNALNNLESKMTSKQTGSSDRTGFSLENELDSSVLSTPEDILGPEKDEDKSTFGGYDHITFYVASADIIAAYFVQTFNFRHYCHRGLETGARSINARVIKNGDVIIQFVSAVRPPNSKLLGPDEAAMVAEIHDHVRTHGDAVKDVAFQVTDVAKVYQRAVNAGAGAILEPTTYKDQFGEITVAKVLALGNLTHTLVDRSRYSGFLTGGYVFDEYVLSERDTAFPVSFDCIDHCVQNFGWNKMVRSCEMYKKMFGFHKFWSVDDKQVHTEFSSLRSTVMASPSESIKMPVNEPAKGLKKSQIEEFLEFYGGPGVQHVALKVDDILSAVKHLRERGVDFVRVPEMYYRNLEQRLKSSKHPEFEESMEKIRELGILVDFDEDGYLLQLFTRPIFDRPTFFFEVIQRRNHAGFGAGNFKGLFEVLEEDQRRRGNLVDQEGEVDPFEEDERDQRGRSPTPVVKLL